MSLAISHHLLSCSLTHPPVCWPRGVILERRIGKLTTSFMAKFREILDFRFQEQGSQKSSCYRWWIYLSVTMVTYALKLNWYVTHKVSTCCEEKRCVSGWTFNLGSRPVLLSFHPVSAVPLSDLLPFVKSVCVCDIQLCIWRSVVFYWSSHNCFLTRLIRGVLTCFVQFLIFSLSRQFQKSHHTLLYLESLKAECWIAAWCGQKLWTFVTLQILHCRCLLLIF